ncbi:hypothetical protein BCR42DRAFT_418824 [Absidia repens]|uniref:Uncharacterized protein n=1 Tax=Absidia repens TaxID=90262 RepID=A0A1X2IC32_9FUNG|nr:hypothetical protein BCR42DRAFT_418824 [Absidia repens]
MDELGTLGMQLKVEDDIEEEDDDEPETLEESTILQTRLAQALCDLAQMEKCIEENRATIENMKRQKAEQSVIKTTISKFHSVELANQIKNYETTSQIIVKELEEGKARYEVLKDHQEELEETLKNGDSLEIEKSYLTSDDDGDNDDFESDQEYDDTKSDSIDKVTPIVVDTGISSDSNSPKAIPAEEKSSTARKKRKLPGLKYFGKDSATITIESDDDAERLVQKYSQDAADHVHQKLLELKR